MESNAKVQPDKGTKFSGYLISGSKFLAAAIMLGVYFMDNNYLFLVMSGVLALSGVAFIVILKKFNVILNATKPKENLDSKIE
jgi:hypothetical protein